MLKNAVIGAAPKAAQFLFILFKIIQRLLPVQLIKLLDGVAGSEQRACQAGVYAGKLFLLLLNIGKLLFIFFLRRNLLILFQQIQRSLTRAFNILQFPVQAGKSIVKVSFKLKRTVLAVLLYFRL